MLFRVQYEYLIKNATVPVLASRAVDLPKWNATEAKNQLLKIHSSNGVKLRITGHK